MISFTTTIDPRIIVKKNTVIGIQNFDLDNAYPQNMEALTKMSGVAKSCVDIYGKFIIGMGFEDLNFYKAVINRRGNTVDQLHRLLVKDFALHKGFVIHCNFDLSGKIVEVNHVPWEQVRLEEEDDDGNVFRAAVYDDWDRKKRRYFQKNKVDWIDLYNPMIAPSRMIEYGADSYNGQLFYFTTCPNSYPLSSIDPVREDVMTDGEIKMFKFRNITTNFMASHMFVYKGKFADDDARDKYQKNLNNFQGGRRAGKIFMVEVTSEKEVPVITPFEQPKTDGAYQWHETSVRDNIRKNFLIPGVLLAEETPGKLGLSQQMVDAIKYFNSVTKEERMIFEETFTNIFSNWQGAINPSGNYKTIPMGTGEFEAENITGSTDPNKGKGGTDGPAN